MVLEGDGTVASVAREFDINATLGNWVDRHRIASAQDERPPASGPDRVRIRTLMKFRRLSIDLPGCLM
ncbi:hypothetical protein SAMN05444920_14021 [Nonomuraea solani]|uniref:Transposase n=1 Tax=Nonomuraea solani TaxID=1144553 RepID=A0A1H6F0D7_9ACTN|nr:hypothetical protein [Nonomuraea solani]SEH03607.1 hypothetical protein SAMN05444920_14021 [Nonomuraea solani]